MFTSDLVIPFFYTTTLIFVRFLLLLYFCFIQLLLSTRELFWEALFVRVLRELSKLKFDCGLRKK